MTAQETATLAQQGEKLDALSYALREIKDVSIREIKDMLIKRDDMCAIHTETIARLATRLDSLDRELERVKLEEVQEIKKALQSISDNKTSMLDKIILLVIGISAGLVIEIIRHMSTK